MKATKPHFIFADILRVIAVLGVITIHSANYILYSGLYSHGFTWWFANIARSTSRVSVPLFVMLSGFLILGAAKKYTYAMVAKKASHRLLVPLVFWYGLTVLWQAFFWHSPILVGEVLSNFLHAHTTHFYYLQALIGLYLSVPLLLKIDQQLHSRFKWLAVVGLFGYAALISSVSGAFPQLSLINAVTIFTVYLGYFYLGKLCHAMKTSQKMLWVLAVVFIVTAILNASGMQNYVFNNFQSHAHYSAPGVVIMAVSLFILLRGLEATWAKWISAQPAKVLAHISASTYGMYLVHYMVKDVIERYVLIISSVRSGLIFYLIANIALVFLVSFGVTEVIRANKVTKKLVGE